MTMTTTLTKRDQKIIWHPYTQARIAPAPIGISRGEGSYLFTESGHKILDGISSWWTNTHGHCHPDISAAISAQAAKLEQVIFANFTHEPAVRLAEELLSVAPRGLSRVFYSDSGSSAVETAIKMAFQYWQHRREHRPYFIALKHGYHGDTFGAMSVSERSHFTKPFWPLLFKVLHTKSTCISDATTSEQEQTMNALDALENLLEKHKDQVGALILEPMLQAAGGFRIFTKNFLLGIKNLCRKHHVLLIADEIATGFYRTGTAFACDHEEVSPDIMCVAKGLTGGFLPLSATLTTEEIFQAFLSDQKTDAFLHGHSFAGNPLGCAAALASLEIFKKSTTKERIVDICLATKEGLVQFVDLPMVKNVRHIGTVAIIELHSDQPGYSSRDADNVVRYCYEKGLYIRPLGNIIYLMPPFSTTKEEIAWALTTIRDALVVVAVER